MARKHDTDTKTPWWRTLPAILTAAATFIGSVAAVLALFVGPGDGGGGANGAAARRTANPTSTPSQEPAVPLKHEPATDANLRKLLAMVPTSMGSRCEQDPSEKGGELARLSCDLGGATFYYELYADELDALDSFTVSVSNERDFANGHARSCDEVRTHRPFVGTWSRPARTEPAGRLLCAYDLGSMSIDWTEKGRPIVGSMLYSGDDRASSLEGAQLVWDRVMG
jgi:hypothetical protein